MCSACSGDYENPDTVEPRERDETLAEMHARLQREMQKSYAEKAKREGRQ